jgi:hypothetical protein
LGQHYSLVLTFNHEIPFSCTCDGCTVSIRTSPHHTLRKHLERVGGPQRVRFLLRIKLDSDPN